MGNTEMSDGRLRVMTDGLPGLPLNNVTVLAVAEVPALNVSSDVQSLFVAGNAAGSQSVNLYVDFSTPPGEVRSSFVITAGGPLIPSVLSEEASLGTGGWRTFVAAVRPTLMLTKVTRPNGVGSGEIGVAMVELADDDLWHLGGSRNGDAAWCGPIDELRVLQTGTVPDVQLQLLERLTAEPPSSVLSAVVTAGP